MCVRMVCLRGVSVGLWRIVGNPRHAYPTAFGFDPGVPAGALREPDPVAFIQRHCRLTKGSRARSTIRLAPWQRKLVKDLMRSRRGRRVHRRALVGMPRKNGKSLLGAGLALYALVGDGEEGAEVYSCAGDRSQARIVFGEAKRMVELDPMLSKVVKPYRDSLEVPSTGSRYRVLSAEAYSKEGLSPSFVVFDEVHVQPNDDLWTVMTLGMGTREQPMILGITTAGYDPMSLCGRLYEHGRRVQAGEVDDPSFFFRWWEPSDPQADWKDPRVWREANPGIPSGFLDEDIVADALNMPGGESAFRRYHLNQWTATATAWLPAGVWAAAADPARLIVAGEPVVLAVDGSWSNDSTALVACTADHVSVVKAWERPAGHQQWRVPMLDVEDAIRDAARLYRPTEIVCDPYWFQRSFHVLEAEGLPMVEFPTNALGRMVPATKKFEDDLLEGRLSHDGHPALARHMGNAVVKDDRYGRRITKEAPNSPRKIDLAVAAVIGHDRATFVPARAAQAVVW